VTGRPAPPGGARRATPRPCPPGLAAAVSFGVALAAVAGLPCRGRAQAPVSFALRPYAPASPPGDPFYLRVLVLEAVPGAAGPPEVIADRRLLRLEVMEPQAPAASGRRAPPRPRVYRCAHPDAPRWRAAWSRAAPPRLTRLEGDERRVAEWIDLREYCRGPARAALALGGSLRATYGFGGVPARGGGGPFVARVPAPEGGVTQSFAALGPHEEALAPPAPAPAPAPPPGPAPASASPAAEVRLRPLDRASARGAVLDLTVRPTAAAARVYLRPDQVSLRVRGPLGAVRCAPERLPIVPIVDFFRRVTPGRPASVRVDLGFLCPSGSFDVAGVYELTPVLELPHRHPGGAPSLVGTFEGPPAALVVHRGERGYVERTPETAGAR
jgi:hypothetical protein